MFFSLKPILCFFLPIHYNLQRAPSSLSRLGLMMVICLSLIYNVYIV